MRRAFLCGTAQLSGKNFGHRKQWIQDWLQFLAGQFGVDVLGFSLMSNYLHLILRNRPDAVAGWSDDEVARRWWNVFPSRTERDGEPSPPQESDLMIFSGNAARLQEVRARLSSVSWFMRCVSGVQEFEVYASVCSTDSADRIKRLGFRRNPTTRISSGAYPGEGGLLNSGTSP